jgi:BCCT family betaine/carnitine transporter
MVFGVIGFGSLGCAAFFSVLGNYALYLELNEVLPSVDMLNQQGPRPRS